MIPIVVGKRVREGLTLNVINAAIACGSLLFSYLLLAVVASYLFAWVAPRWLSVVMLFISIHLSAAYFGRRMSLSFQEQDLVKLTAGCSIAWWLFDEGTPLAIRWLGLDPAPSEEFPIFTAIVATAICGAVVAAIVFLSIPLAEKYYRRDKPTIASTSPSDDGSV